MVPHDAFPSTGPYVVGFYFMNICSTSNLDKYMACSNCIQPRATEQLNRYVVAMPA